MIKPILSILVLLLISAAATSTQAQVKKVIYPSGTQAGGSYSPGILIDGTLCISGQNALDASGKVPDTFEGEVKQSLANIAAVLKAANMTPADVVSVQVYLTDVANFPQMNSLYRVFFNDPRPTRTTVVVAKLVDPVHIEITVTARK